DTAVTTGDTAVTTGDTAVTTGDIFDTSKVVADELEVVFEESGEVSRWCSRVVHATFRELFDRDSKSAPTEDANEKRNDKFRFCESVINIYGVRAGVTN
ncbi:MAG: hypothetical protein LBI60_00815, partial [Bacteroidales bacterium]|nr:hypothetical protein [Bacteroidales bacterium]